jgi:hypothetical protein
VSSFTSREDSNDLVTSIGAINFSAHHEPGTAGSLAMKAPAVVREIDRVSFREGHRVELLQYGRAIAVDDRGALNIEVEHEAGARGFSFDLCVEVSGYCTRHISS